jgi:hypothetical protein
MIAAFRARISAAFRELMKSRVFAAVAADMPNAIAQLDDAFQASVVIRELGEELTDGELFARHDSFDLRVFS